MPENEEATPPIWVRGAAAAPWPRTIKSVASSFFHMQFSLPSRRGLGPRPPKARFPRLEGQIDRIWGTPPESKGASSAKPPKKPNHAPLLPKTSGCREPKKTTQKQLKWPRRDSNPGRGRSTPRPFFARPKPHHPSMRLGEVEHSKVSYLCQSPGKSGILAPLSRVHS